MMKHTKKTSMASSTPLTRRTALIIALLLTFALMFSYRCVSAKTITEYEYVNGIRCKRRQNILTYLFMGIDDYGGFHPQKSDVDTPGQCDMLAMLVIDKSADTYAIININRNTVTGVHSISDYDGRDMGVFPMQIALAHTTGDGFEQSCEVVATAVSDLLLGIHVDHYVAATMDVIGPINASVGGVTVTIEDDFSQVAPDLVMGETIHLTDEQAVKFLRTRQRVGDEGNEGRMRRQRQYADAFKPLFIEKYRQDVTFPLDLVHSLSDYMVTDMTDKDFSYIAKALDKNEDLGTYSPEGVTEVDEYGWEAFTPDGDSITSIVTKLFYKVVEE